METNLDEIWQATLGELEVVLSTANFNTWFKDTGIADISDGQATVRVPNNFSREWLQKKYHGHILNILQKLVSVKSVTYKIITPGKPPLIGLANAKPATTNYAQQNQEAQPFPLKEDFTFETFIVGPHNRLAHATSLAVAQHPGKTHNPLFIYGGVGLGKTHLMCAIGHQVIKTFPNKKVLYISCENFANEYISSIQNKRTESFKKKYRSVDVFLIDDIQFLSRKEGTQEEFFHTFNHLYQNNRQIVMTSDRIPRAITDLEERLSSRLSGGMIADITTPNLETRQAILQGKALKLNWSVPPEVIEFVATNITTNIRELEGALNRVIAYADLHKQQPSLQMAQTILENIVSLSKHHTISPEKLLKIVTQFFNITIQDILSPKRSRDLVLPRQIAMYLMRSELSMSYPQIGRFLNGKDHTTVMHGYNLINREIARNDSLREQVNLIKEKMFGV